MSNVPDARTRTWTFVLNISGNEVDVFGGSFDGAMFCSVDYAVQYCTVQYNTVLCWWNRENFTTRERWFPDLPVDRDE